MAEVIEISEIEKKEIRNAYNRLYRKIRSSLTDEDKDFMAKAYKMAYHGHRHQRRKSGEPYFLHPIEVARICSVEIGLGPTAVICALLHDVVEDTEYTLDDIRENFNPKITTIVDGLTKLDGLYNVESQDIESPQAENFKKVLSTLVEDVRVVLIKMADRLHNLRTIDHMPVHKKLKIAAETNYVYSPLAHRLGLYKIKTEYQDIYLKITEPEHYHEIKENIEATQSDRESYIKEFINPIKKRLKKEGIPTRFLARIKAISSISNKLKTKKVPFEEIYDLFAIRVIIDVPVEQEKSICWQIYSVITDFYTPIPERLKDWVTTPKGNGYESLHTTVIGPNGRFVEVQIRSERMDQIAEKGFAAHWKYKGVKDQNSVYDRWLNSIRDVLDTQHSNALEFLNDFKTNLFSEEIYVFTPTGDMRILPKGATALDFAFEIHSQVGYNCTAIKVNNKLVPMGYKLSNGDQLHVTTSKNQKPNENWLKMVVTGKARSKIRSAMKEERREKGELGKEALQRKLRNMKVDFEENVETVVNFFGFKNRADLYFSIAMDSIKLTDLKAFKVEQNKLVLKETEITDTPNTEISPAKTKKETKKRKSNILVNGEPADQYEFVMSPCCNPVNGDDIFGYLTATKGLKIHRTSCPNATHLMANFGYRILKAEWTNRVGSNFVVDLVITGVDSGIGVIQSLTHEISTKLGINIRSFSISGDEGYFEGKVSLVVINKDQLNVALKAIGKLNGISSVTRIDKSSHL